MSIGGGMRFRADGRTPGQLRPVSIELDVQKWTAASLVYRQGDTVGGLLLVSAPVNWQIDYVVVCKEMRGRGIATSLVNETLNQALARKVPYVMLTSKASLRPLYEGQGGFTVLGGRGPENEEGQQQEAFSLQAVGVDS